MSELVKQAKIGTIVPVYKEINEEINALEYFAKLSDYGRKKNSLLMENREKSFGTANPCLKVTGKRNDFEIAALNSLGKRFLNFIKKDFKFCDKAMYGKGRIYGKLTPAGKAVSEQEKLKLKTHIDILRAIAFKFNPTEKPFSPYCGLFGMVSYDFANPAEDDSEGMLKDPDYLFYFVDNMFMVDHKTKKTYFVANALITEKNNGKAYNECAKTINNYEKVIGRKAPKGKKPKKRELKPCISISDTDFIASMKVLKKHIADGDILYAAPSRITLTNYNAEPLDVYSSLRADSEYYAFYVNDAFGISICADAAALLTVGGEDEKTVELRIAAASRPGSAAKEGIDEDLDNKHEALLKADENEVACSIMLADAARNDVARVSEPGTRHVDKLLVVEKQFESQNLISSVKGILSKELDALHAYSAAFNPPATAGMPKMMSMQVLRSIEKGKRGFSSGSFLYVTPEKDIYGMAVAPIRIKKDKAYFMSDSRVFYSSNDEKFIVGNNKSMKILDALKFGGFK